MPAFMKLYCSDPVFFKKNVMLSHALAHNLFQDPRRYISTFRFGIRGLYHSIGELDNSNEDV